MAILTTYCTSPSISGFTRRTSLFTRPGRTRAGSPTHMPSSGSTVCAVHILYAPSARNIDVGSLGTDIAVYGVALPNPQLNNDGITIAATIPPSARFSIDGGIPLTVVSNPDLQEAEYAHQFYDSHTLPTGEHVLQMNVTYGTAEWPFVLDYIQYTPLQAQPPSVGQGASAGGSAGASKPRVPSVAIGASVAGVMLVLAIAALFRYWNHLSRRRKCGIRTSPKEKVDLLEEGKSSESGLCYCVDGLT